MESADSHSSREANVIKSVNFFLFPFLSLIHFCMFRKRTLMMMMLLLLEKDAELPLASSSSS